MNFALMISVKLEEMLAEVVRDDSWSQHDEDKEYKRCLAQVISGVKAKPQAGGDIRIGDYILLGTSSRRKRGKSAKFKSQWIPTPASRKIAYWML